MYNNHLYVNVQNTISINLSSSLFTVCKCFFAKLDEQGRLRAVGALPRFLSRIWRLCICVHLSHARIRMSVYL